MLTLRAEFITPIPRSTVVFVITNITLWNTASVVAVKITVTWDFSECYWNTKCIIQFVNSSLTFVNLYVCNCKTHMHKGNHVDNNNYFTLWFCFVVVVVVVVFFAMFILFDFIFLNCIAISNCSLVHGKIVRPPSKTRTHPHTHTHPHTLL